MNIMHKNHTLIDRLTCAMRLRRNKVAKSSIDFTDGCHATATIMEKMPESASAASPTKSQGSWKRVEDVIMGCS